MPSLAEQLSDHAAQTRAASGAPVLMGLCGPQGAGKSTLAGQLAERLIARGLATVVLSIDDFYLTRSAREELARRVHPLLRTRGPPGTHEIEEAVTVVDALLEGRPVEVPRFDKRRDDRRPSGPAVAHGPVDVVVLEGWCVGARPQSSGALRRPVNALEAREDADGVWRRYVNDALAGAYQDLWRRITVLVLLLAPGFDIVPRWRQQQEQALRAGSPDAATMTDGEVARFVQLFERLTRHIASEAPSRADVVVRLDENRAPIAVDGL